MIDIKDKVVLITGGSGSLGKELLPILLKERPASIRVISNDENQIHQLSEEFKHTNVRPLIGDIRDKDRLYRAMNGVEYVIHTAALKHVYLSEYNPMEAVKTNVVGSMNVIDCAIDNNVKKVIAISSDKAVHPINLYGATKLVMEKLFKNAGHYGKTKFACVRFGNFIGSRGSFLEGIDEKKVVNITDERMKRYWIPLEQAADFTIKCLEIMEGGEVFVPKMTEHSVMEFVHGRPVEIIGKRDGEKLSEMLFAEGEVVTDKGGYFVVC